MYEGASIAVVVPAYNEEGFVGEVIDSVPGFVDTTFMIDDHSTDGTWEEVSAHVQTAEQAPASVSPDGGESMLSTDESGVQAQGTHAQEEAGRLVEETYAAAGAGSLLDGDVVPVRNPENRGRGNAVKTGYRLALLSGHDVIAVMDGDGQMDPAALPDLLDPIVDGEADYTKGNRLVSFEHCGDMSNWRLFGNVLLTGLTKIASGQYHLRDPQNGYTAISAEAVSELSLSEVYDGYGFLNDLLIRLAEHGFSIVDIPIRAVYSDEESGIRYKSFVPNLSLLLLKGFSRRLWNRYVRSDRSRTDLQEPTD